MLAHHSPSFLWAGCSSCHPTDSVKTLKQQSKATRLEILQGVKERVWKWIMNLAVTGEWLTCLHVPMCIYRNTTSFAMVTFSESFWIRSLLPSRRGWRAELCDCWIFIGWNVHSRLGDDERGTDRYLWLTNARRVQHICYHIAVLLVLENIYYSVTRYRYIIH